MKRLILIIVFLASVLTLTAQYNKAWFFWMGRQHLASEQYRDAIRIYNALLRVDPDNSEAFFYRGIAKANLDDNLGAESDFTLAIDNNPLNTLAWHHRAVSRMLLGSYDDALADFARAIEIRPDLPGPYYSRGYTYLMNRRFGEAIADLDTYIFHNNRAADAYLLRGTAHLQNRDTLAAVRDFDTAIVTNRDNPEGYLRRGALRMEQGRPAEALEDFETAVARDSSYLNSYFNRALARERLGRFDGALSDLDRVIAMDGDNPAAYYNRAIVHNRTGAYAAALEDYTRVTELAPENVVAWYNRAIIRNRLGDLPGAESDFSRAIELYPDFAAAYSARSEVRFLRGETRAARQDRQLAERKIAEYRSRLDGGSTSSPTGQAPELAEGVDPTDETGHAQSDEGSPAIDPTDEIQSKLMSFETRFTGSNFDRLASERDNLALLPLFRFTLRTADTTRTIGPLPYFHAGLERFRTDADIPQLVFSREGSNVDSGSTGSPTGQVPELVEGPADDPFKRSIVQSISKQYTNSLGSVSQAIDAAPDNPYLYINRSTTRAEMIDFISSIGASSSRRLTIESDPELRMTGAARQTYDYNDALKDIETAIKLDPTLAHSHYNRANLLAMSGRLVEAFGEYSRAIELNPHFAEAYYNRGLVQIYLRDTRKGYLDISKAGEEGIPEAYELIKNFNIK